MALVTPTASTTAANETGTLSNRLAFSFVTVLFFMFGFITVLNDILVPHLKALFELNYAQAALVQFTFFGAFFLVSIPAGYVVNKIGYQKGTVYGLVLTAIGCSLFYPAAQIQSYGLFLFGLFVLASGVTQIQVAVNPYVSVLGPSETASVRLNLSQAFNSLGTTIAPILGTAFILAGAVKNSAELQLMSATELADYRDMQADAVKFPYLGLTIALLVLAFIVSKVKLPKIPTETDSSSNSTLFEKIFGTVLQHRPLVLGAIAIFCYVGAEVAIGSYLINFFGLPEILNYKETSAGSLVALYWGGAMVGRFAGAAVLSKIKPEKVLMANAIIAGILVIAAMVLTGWAAAISILAVGLFNSIMFPTIFTIAIEGLGERTPQASGVLCMAIVGGAIIPVMQGALADQIQLHHSFILPVLCYGFIAYYALDRLRPRANT